MGKYCKENNQQSIYLKLEEYLLLAKKIIKKYSCNKKLFTDDNISFIAQKMMQADKRFDGRGDRKKYRIYCGKLGFKSIIFKYKKDKIINSVSLYDKFGTSSIIDFIPNIEEKYVNMQKIAYDIIQTYCPENYKLLMVEHFIKGKTYSELKGDTTKQNICLKIKNAIKHIKENMDIAGISSINFFIDT